VIRRKPQFLAGDEPERAGSEFLPENVRGLVFDFDGTLADTMPLHWQAWQRLIARHGIQLSEARFYALGGVPSRDILRMLAREQGRALDALALAHEKELEYLSLLPQATLIPETAELARQNRGRRPQAVASGGTRRVIEQALEQFGLRDCFAAVVTSEDVTHQKPAPDIFIEAARRLGVPVADCLGFEDTDLGLEGIRAAGMPAVDVRELLPWLRQRKITPMVA